MCMDEDSKPLLTFNTHLGLYRLNRLPYGVASAPALWQRAMDALLGDLPNVKCMIDDIIVTGRTLEEHLQTLGTVPQRLSEAGLKLNLSKFVFFQDKVEYCGHVISSAGLHTQPSKVAAIIQAPPPANVTQVRSFLGLVTYYQRFIPDMATVLGPLTELLQNGKEFHWSRECERAFEKVKQSLASDRVLIRYTPDLPIRLASDASPYGLGAVLSHVLPTGDEHPIAFASRKLSKAEQGYSQIDREALAIVWAVKKFHTYLYGRHFKLLTDHQPLVSIFHPCKAYQQWQWLACNVMPCSWLAMITKLSIAGCSNIAMQMVCPVFQLTLQTRIVQRRRSKSSTRLSPNHSQWQLNRLARKPNVTLPWWKHTVM